MELKKLPLDTIVDNDMISPGVRIKMTDYLEAKSIALIFLGLTVLAISFAAYRLKSKIRAAEREQSEMGSRLTDARKRERSLIENAVDVICIIDVDGKFLSVNPAAERAWGYKESDLVGHSLSEFLEGGSSDLSLASVLGAQASIDKISFENRLRHKSGKFLDLLWSAHWSASDNGLFCVAHDISKRKQAELQLQESESRIRNTMEAMPVAVACTNLISQIEYANKHLEELTNKTSIDIIGCSLSEFFDDEKDRVHKFLIEPHSAGESKIESFMHGKNGDKIDVEVSVSKFMMKEQEKLLVTISDITHRKQVQRLKQQYVSMVNHDLKTPLASLTGMISILEQGTYGELNQQGKQLCELADAELGRLLQLVGELLELDRLESGEFPLNKALVSVQDVIEAASSSVKAFAALKNVEIKYDDYETACFADRKRIIQVLVNLLSNAVKFSPQNSQIEITSATDVHGATSFTVQDKGRGIPAGKEEFIFERFKQLDPNDDIERGGSGLGLAICKALVEAHGGKISCKSDGSGSVFYFTLPPKTS